MPRIKTTPCVTCNQPVSAGRLFMESVKFNNKQVYFEAKEALERAEEKIYEIELGDKQHLIGTQEHKKRKQEHKDAINRFNAVCATVK